MKWCVICTKHTFFIGEMLVRNLKRHFSNVVISMEMPNKFDYDFYIVICAQTFSRMPPPECTFIYQLEQATSHIWWTDKYFAMLKNCAGILDYSLYNLKFLETKGIGFPNTYYVPIGAVSNFRPTVDQAKEFDFIFYGSMKVDRRQKMLTELSKHFKVATVDNLYGNNLYSVLRKARSILNIHYYQPSVLETTRISECISLRLPVLSETAEDSKLYPEFSNAVQFFKEGSVEEAIEKGKDFLANLPNNESMDDAIFKSENKMSFMLDRFLASKRLITIDRVISPIIASDKIVLSLPETIKRRETAEIPQGYKFFDGLRLTPGWRGCGASYKMLAMDAMRNLVPELRIMEDDVELPSDFNKKIKNVNAFLKINEGKWDVFSGFIADMHPDAKILDVKTYKGLTFVTVDKMTSTVFNIYSSNGIRMLGAWDISNDRVENTIDRHMERQPNLRVIFVWPYLVGHKEEHQSTIWPHSNSQYQGMIAQSERTINEKLKQFKERK